MSQPYNVIVVSTFCQITKTHLLNFVHYFSVANLQHAIAMEYPIPEEKQVLLISGGESLDPAAVVGKYHAGTVCISTPFNEKIVSVLCLHRGGFD